MILGSGLLTSGVPSFGTVAADSSDSALFSGYAPNVATVGPVSRRLYFGKSGGTWRTLWTDTSGALLRGDGAGTYAITKASDGPEPFDTDTGLATDVYSGSVSAGTTFVHEADFVMEFTVDALPTTANGIRAKIRAADTDNYWLVYVNQTGGLYLYEFVAGGLTARASAAAVVSAGHRIVVIAEGTTIKAYSGNTKRWEYSGATNFATETAGELNAVTGGAVSDLITWPRTLSGTAAAILDKVSA